MRPLLLLTTLLLCSTVFARNYTEQEGRAAWAALKKQPINEETFRKTCDLMQDIGKTNLSLSYEMLAEYVPMVKATGNDRWVHILLMGWAKAKASLGFFEEGQALYKQARDHAGTGTRYYREAVVGTVLMYLEWGKADSLKKYVSIGEQESKQANDKENLSFIYTFKAMAEMGDTAAMHNYLEQAMDLSRDIPDKNALFTAMFDYAIIYCQYSPQKQVNVLDTLLVLANDSSLNHHQKLYERTAYCFRNPGPSVNYELFQVNLLLTDYENAWKFAELFYNATVKPNPTGVQAPYFDAEMAVAKAYQGDFVRAQQFLDTSRALFKMTEDSIPYISYFYAAGMLAEHAHQYQKALHFYEIAQKKGNTEGLHMMPAGMYYAHGLILTQKLKEAEQALTQFQPLLQTRKYSAIGFYYYKDYAELLKAKGDYAGYAKALETFYNIKDSLSNLNRYRAIQEVETRMRLRDKEQQILRLDEESNARLESLRKDRLYFLIVSGLSVFIIILLVGYARNLNKRKRQAEQIASQNEILQQNKLKELEKQHRIEVMQGAIDAEEHERHKIADQLHDEVGAMLSLASLNISSTLEKGLQDGQSEEKLHKSQEILSSVSSTIRDLSHRLTPLVIEKYGLKKALEELTNTINLSEKLKLETIIVGFDNSSKYPVAFLNDLYRMIQEFLHNVVKHARASHAMLELVEHEDHISLMIEDDGIGMQEEHSVKGKGIKSIQSKVAYLNGHLEITGKKDSGTLIVVELPVQSV